MGEVGDRAWSQAKDTGDGNWQIWIFEKNKPTAMKLNLMKRMLLMGDCRSS